MPKTQPEPAEVEVVALVEIHSGPPEYPQCAKPGERVTLPREVAEKLIAAGHATRTAN